MGRHPTVAVDVADLLTTRIGAGKYVPGNLLPATRRLQEELGVSRSAVIGGIRILAERGLVEIQKNRGAKVTGEIPHKSGLARALSVRRTGRIYAPGEYARITAAELVAAPADVAGGLRLEPGTQVIRRHRVTYNGNGTIESASTSWYDGVLSDAAPLLLSTERIPEGSWSYLESQTGRRAIRGIERVKARMATGEEAEELGVSRPAAVKVATLVLYDANDGVIEYGVSVAATEREAEYEFDLPA
jgi:GntR family transcriptional regulator